METPDFHKGDESLSSKKWESKKPPVFGKDFFKLQFDFAEAIQKKTGEPFLGVVEGRTSLLRFNAFNYMGLKFVGFKDGVTADNIVDFAYSEYLKSLEKKDLKPAEYHPVGSRRFGCFSYDYGHEPGVVYVHFSNEEFDTVGPLSETKIEQRRGELRDMLIDIKKNTKMPVSEVSGLSWLYNLPAYKRFFPDSYVANLVPDLDSVQWKRGNTIWGQFYDNNYKLRQALAQELLDKLKDLPVEVTEDGENILNLGSVFDGYDQGKTNLKPPMTTHGPIVDFYQMYKI